MELSFVNGTELQQAACRTVAHNLLNLPFESINLKHTVEFSPDPLPSSHNEFAVTTWTYDNTEPFTKIASIAPEWAEPWRGVKFLQECYAHELGHGFFAALPEAMRFAIAEMFGVDTDDVDVLFPEDADWEDRPGEGIAETFKDAFLPRRFRRYANRTNHTIPIHKYPEFRALWRAGAPEVGSNEADFEQDLLEGFHSNINGPEDPVWESHVTGLEQEINEATDFHYSFTVPRSWFPVTATNPFVIYGYVQFALRLKDKETGDVLHFARGAWQLVNNTLAEVDSLLWSDSEFKFIYNFPEPPNVEEAEDNGEGGSNHWHLYAEDAVSLGRPTFTINHSFSIPAGKTVVVQAWALIQPQPSVFVPLDPTIAAEIASALPHLIYREGGAAGEPIILPESEMKSGGHTSGRRLKNSTIVGRSR